MQTTGKSVRGKAFAPKHLLLLVVPSLFVARDAPAGALRAPRQAADMFLFAELRQERVATWAAALEPIEIANASTGASARIRFYDSAGEVDEEAQVAFEQVASREPEPRRLALRVEQLVIKAAYHFGASRVSVVSAWRARAGKHTTAEAVDFRLDGVYAPRLAAYLRGLPRVGVGVYTNPATQYVHIDIREPSYAWIDASPPGVHWKERQLGIPHAAERDAAYEPEMDLPL